MRETIPENLVGEDLRHALTVRRPPTGLIVHSDQSNQYTATRFEDLLTRYRAVPSMSRADAATVTTMPTPNRFETASRSNCSMTAALRT